MTLKNKKINPNNNLQQETKNYKKKYIPKALKIAIWNKYIGEEIGKVKCLCCEITDITQLKFHTGHVIAEKNGGDTSIENLRPICESCNKSMNTTNMYNFKQLLMPQSKKIICNTNNLCIKNKIGINYINNDLSITLNEFMKNKESYYNNYIIKPKNIKMVKTKLIKKNFIKKFLIKKILIKKNIIFKYMKILILGATGMLGYQMFKFFSAEDFHDVYGTVRFKKNVRFFKL